MLELPSFLSLSPKNLFVIFCERKSAQLPSPKEMFCLSSSTFKVHLLAFDIFLDYWGHLSVSKNFCIIHKIQRCVVPVVTLKSAIANIGAI